MPDVVVVGAGLSGLGCARRLKREGLDVVVLEAADIPGGVVTSEQVDGYLIESGPNTILPTSEAIAMIADAGIESEMITAPAKAPRFVYVGGRLRRVPWVLTAGGFLRALAEPFVGRRTDAGDESLESFFQRRFGRQAYERLAAPFASGIYAGDPAQLGVQSVFPGISELEQRYGSVILGLLRRPRSGPRYGLRSFRKGMGTLAHGLASGIDVRYGAATDRVTPEWNAQFGPRSVGARSMVLAVPAHVASGLLGEVDPSLAGMLDQVCYAPIVVVNIAAENRRMRTPLEGFGFLVPRGEGLNLLGTLFNSCLFPGRSPEGFHLLTCFMGGALAPDVVEWSGERIRTTACSEVERVLDIDTGSARVMRLRRYRAAIPQYPIEHGDWLSRIETQVERLRGLYLTGSYFSGVSVPAAMAHGARTAESVLEYMRRVG